MSENRLESRTNSVLKRFRLVASGAKRAPQDLTLCEGVRALEEATASGSAFDCVVADETFGTHEPEGRLLGEWRRRGVRLYRAPARLLGRFSDLTAPQGAMALVRVPGLALEEVPESPLPLIVCACGIQDPGNLGTLVRAAAAAGASMVCCTPGTVSARNPKAVRASAGLFFRIPVVERVAPDAMLSYCRRRGITVYRTDAATGTAYRRVDLRLPTALLLGNEARGIEFAASAGLPAVRIPLAPGIESLNVAVAGAIVLFEARHQRTVGKESR